MKKIMSLAAIAAVTVLSFTACEKNEDENNTATVTFEGSYFTALIDSAEYNGPLIYSGLEYKWTDETTSLSSECLKDDWSQWGMGYGWSNGIAISNYICNDSVASYDRQLSVPASNGSKNFAVVWDNDSKLTFADGKNHVVKSIMVSPTTYTLRNMQKSCGKDYEFKVILTGIQADSTKKSVEIYLANGTDVLSGWKSFDLNSLGAVSSISFSFDGSDKGKYGVNTPKYVAIDNIVVEL